MSFSPDLITSFRAGLNPGLNRFLSRTVDTTVGLDFGIYCLNAHQPWRWSDRHAEGALLVLSGRGILRVNDNEAHFERSSWIDTAPWVAHGPANSSFEIVAETPCEIAWIATENAANFPHKIYRPESVEAEHRGKGLWDNAAYRIVRLVFDATIAPPEAKLVVGEVVNFPGRWSSYPPHHHSQPEIYYYRFDKPQGYGHGELGEQIFRIKHHDLLRITDDRSHAQVAAPGYHMYYLWAIRHLPHAPYRGFEFDPEHQWLLKETTP